MSPLPRPTVDCTRQHPSICVPDVLAAAHYYVESLGFSLGFTWGDPPAIAGVNLGDVQIFLERGTPSPEGVALYFVVGNADELFEFQRENGATVLAPPADRDYGLRDYRVRDPYGYPVSFGHYIYSAGPSIEIERVDVPVRLEKRLAAVLTDLAAFKRMSLTSCLEETLLHTMEPLRDGVASPHTPRDLREIQALKAKHGLDYDCHASYRFVERPQA